MYTVYIHTDMDTNSMYIAIRVLLGELGEAFAPLG